MSDITTIYLVRHAQSEGNAGILTNEIGHKLGSGLTELGKKQAEELAEKLKNEPIDTFFSSDMKRARETAEIIAKPRDKEVTTNSTIRERGYFRYLDMFGDSEEQFFAKMVIDLQKLDEKEKMRYKISPTMESTEEAALRVNNFLQDIVKAHTEKTLLVVIHGNIFRSFLTHIGYAKYDELPTASIENTGYAILKSNGTKFEVSKTFGINKQEGAFRTF